MSQQIRLQMISIIGFAICGIVFVEVIKHVPASAALADEPNKPLTLNEWNELWDEMKQVSRPAKADLSPEEREAYWSSQWRNPLISQQLSSLPETDEKAIIDRIVNDLGQSDAGDFRVFTELWSWLTPLKRFRPKEDDSPIAKRTKWELSHISETQVRDWCRHPQKVERIVWFAAWAGYLTRGRNGKTYPESIARDLAVDFEAWSLKSVDASFYWPCARTFVFLACLTNRSDLYVGRDPAKLGEAYTEWNQWFQELRRARRLRASQMSPSWVEIPAEIAADNPNAAAEGWDLPMLAVVPESPFPGWGDLPPPPSRRWFREVSGEP
jgi:hypothetical protein